MNAHGTIRFPALPAALAIGAINVFSFAPFGIWPLHIVTLAVMFALALRTPSPKRAALLGWAYGFASAAACVHWMFISMHRYGGLPAWMAVLAVALLALYLGLFSACAFGAGVWLKRRWQASDAVTALLILPALWMLGEWLRGWMLTGFPWTTSGYAHTAGPLAGYAPLTGVYGLAGIAAAIAGSLALLPACKRAAGIALVLLAAGFPLRQIDWTRPHGNPVSIRLLQGNVAQDMKFEPSQIRAALAQYREMIVSQAADLIVTPETALPLLSSQLPREYVAHLREFAFLTGSHIALGLPVNDAPGRYANSMVGLSPDASARDYRYDKHHLVPFGEFIPPGARWFVEMMNIPLGDFTRGGLPQQPFAVRDQLVMPNICYEDLFGEEIAAQLSQAGQQVTILLNMSNIAWFGHSIALPQHLQISQMRALETGRPMLRATNTGMTAVIDPKGRVSHQLPPLVRAELAASVQGYAGLTPYGRFGNAIALLGAALLLGAAWLQAHKRTETR